MGQDFDKIIEYNENPNNIVEEYCLEMDDGVEIELGLFEPRNPLDNVMNLSQIAMKVFCDNDELDADE